MLLNEIFIPQSIKLNLEGKTKNAVFIELAEIMAEAHPGCNRSVLLAAIQERENKMSTGCAAGIAIPHAFCGGINNMIGAIGVSRKGIDYGALDGNPVYVVFMLAMEEQARENHLRILNQIVRLAQSDALKLVRDANNAQDIYHVLSRFQ
jgi:PTS system fructose-specific IIC component/PTS system nitrogen regulatory IIA component